MIARHLSKLATVAAAFVWCLSPWVTAQESAPASRAATDLRAAIAAELQAAAKKAPLVGLSAAVVRGGKVAAISHVGFEDREKAVPASDATMYRWASISKPLTAVVAMQLAGEKTLDLDRDVRKYVPEFPEKPWPVTARQILCHQSGIVHYKNGQVIGTVEVYAVEHPAEHVILNLDAFKESPLLFEPGTRYSYTTHGYMLLGAVCECAARRRYADLVHDRIAAKAGMTTLQPDYQWIDIPHRAVGYRKKGDGLEKSTDTDVSWKLPGGGFISSVGDLARFGAAMLGSALVDDATKSAMWTPQKTKTGDATTYGLGFGVAVKNGRRRISHSGAQEKTSTFLLMLPDEPGGPIAVAVMTNTEGASLGPVAEALAAIAAR